MDTDNQKIPINLSECFDILEEIMKTTEDKEWFDSSSEEEFLNSTHHALGEWIRDNWSLWNKNSILYQYFFKLGLWHPDDISTFILRSYHRFANKKDLNLSSQIDRYVNYWKEYKTKYGPIK